MKVTQTLYKDLRLIKSVRKIWRLTKFISTISIVFAVVFVGKDFLKLGSA